MKEYLTTGEAAALCSVTPDAVLKWVKAGKIPAHRTPGGHCRIHHSDLTTLLQKRADVLPGESLQGKSFQYCWEFNVDSGEFKSGCQDCIVYRSRAHRCYEMSNLSSETGHAKIFCTDSCETCNYYHQVRWQKQNLLIVTDKPRLRRTIEWSQGEEFNLRFTDCEYHCSMVIESYRPDYVILDCSLGTELARQFARNIAADPRIPLARMIMVGSRDEFPTECDKEIFALVERPLTARVLKELIGNLVEGGLAGLKAVG